MIVYGTGGKLLSTTTLSREACPQCGNRTHVLQVFQRYAHVFWIPFFPTRKVAALVCGECECLHEGKGIPDAFQESVARAKEEVRAPLYHFAGLALVALFAVFLVYSAGQDHKQMVAYFAEPEVGDLYITTLNDEDPAYPYMVLGLVDMGSDSLDFLLGSYGYTKIAGAKEAIAAGAVKDSAYFMDIVRIDRESLDAMLQEKIIRQIIRPEEE